LYQMAATMTLTPASIVSGSSLLWPAVISMYGTLRPGISQIRLEQQDGSFIVGTIVINPNDDRFVLFDVDPDTVPQNTLDPIDCGDQPIDSGPARWPGFGYRRSTLSIDRGHWFTK
jgi:hypothetical protein